MYLERIHCIRSTLKFYYKICQNQQTWKKKLTDAYIVTKQMPYFKTVKLSGRKSNPIHGWSNNADFKYRAMFVVVKGRTV